MAFYVSSLYFPALMSIALKQHGLGKNRHIGNKAEQKPPNSIHTSTTNKPLTSMLRISSII